MGGCQGLQSEWQAPPHSHHMFFFLHLINTYSSGLHARYSSTHLTNIALVNPHTRLLTRQYCQPHFQERKLIPERLRNLFRVLQPVGVEPWVQPRQSAPEAVLSPLCHPASSPAARVLATISGNRSMIPPHWLRNLEPRQTSGRGQLGVCQSSRPCRSSYSVPSKPPTSRPLHILFLLPRARFPSLFA